jgi:mono/diheme cytochrome c family protein
MKCCKSFIVLVIFAITFFCGSYGMTEEIQNVLPPNPLTIKELPEFRVTKGEVLYSRYCSFCHGESGGGDGLNAYSIPIKPLNFNDQAVMAQKLDIEIEKVILSGGVSQGLSKYMPAFGKTLSTLQVKHLVRFIRTKQGGKKE